MIKIIIWNNIWNRILFLNTYRIIDSLVVVISIILGLGLDNLW